MKSWDRLLVLCLVVLVAIPSVAALTFAYRNRWKGASAMSAESARWIKVPIVQDATETAFVNLQGGKIIRVQTSGDNGWTGGTEWIGVKFATRDSTTYGQMALPVLSSQAGRPPTTLCVAPVSVLNTGPMIAPGWANPDVGTTFPILGSYAQDNLGTWYAAMYPYNWVQFTIMDSEYNPTPIAADDGTNFILLLVIPPEDAPKPWEPAGAGYQVIPVQFADNQSSSPEVDLGDSRIVGFYLPAEWVTAEVTFTIIVEPGVSGGGLWTPTSTGLTEYILGPLGAQNVYYLDPAILAGFRYIMINSGSQTNGATTQTDEPVVKLIVRPV